MAPHSPRGSGRDDKKCRRLGPGRLVQLDLTCLSVWVNDSLSIASYVPWMSPWGEISGDKKAKRFESKTKCKKVDNQQAHKSHLIGWTYRLDPISSLIGRVVSSRNALLVRTLAWVSNCCKESYHASFHSTDSEIGNKSEQIKKRKQFHHTTHSFCLQKFSGPFFLILPAW